MGDWEVTKAPAAPSSDWVVTSAPKVSRKPMAPAIPDPTVGGAISDLSPGDLAEGIAGVGNSIVDRASFGAYEGLNKLAGDPLSVARGINKYREEHPIVSQITDAPGYLEGAPKYIAGAVERSVPFVGKALKSTLAASGTGALMGGTEALIRNPTDPVGAGEGAAGGAGMGLALGAPMAVGAKGLGLLGEAVLNSKGGRARAALERKGGATVSTKTPGKGGVFGPGGDLENIAEGSKGEAQAAYKGATGLLDQHETDWANATDYTPEQYRTPVNQYADQMSEARPALKEPVRDVSAATPGAESKLADVEASHADTKRTYGARKAQIDQQQASMPRRDVTHIKQQLESELYDAETPDKAIPKLQRALDVLNRNTDAQGRVMMSERELNGLRRNVYGGTSIGKSDLRPGAEAPQRELGANLKEMVDEGPYADLNEFYAKGSAEHAADREWLGLKKRPGGDRAADVERIAKRESRAKYANEKSTYDEQSAHADQEEAARVDDFKSAKARARKPREQLGLTEKIPEERRIDRHKLKRNLLDRQKDTHTSGGPMEGDPESMDTYLNDHPESREAWRYADLPELAFARNDLSFGIKPRGGDLLKKTDAGHSWMERILRNAAPIQGRLLYPGAREAALAEDPALRLNPLFQAVLGRGDRR